MKLRTIPDDRAATQKYGRAPHNWHCPARIDGECGDYQDPNVDPKDRKQCSTFRCNACEQHVPWCFGAADDAPGLCADCWVRYVYELDESDESAPLRG